MRLLHIIKTIYILDNLINKQNSLILVKETNKVRVRDDIKKKRKKDRRRNKE